MATETSELDLRFEHAFDIRINFEQRRRFGPIYGNTEHGFTAVGTGCTVQGPLLSGRLIDHSGADWPVIRADGVVELNAHYMIEADDGALIYLRNLGYVHGPLRTPEQSPGDPPAIPAYFRCTPYFRAPEGRYGWLNRTVIVGVGKRKPQVHPGDEPDHSLFRYYVIR